MVKKKIGNAVGNYFNGKYSHNIIIFNQIL